MALVNVLIQGLHMLSDAGVWICVVQSPRGEDPKFLQTAWTVQVVRGFYLWLASFVIAWPAAWFYGEHILLYFIPIVGVTSAISGFNSVSMFLQNRRLALFRLALIELCSYAIPTGTALALMPIWPSVWLLVLSGVGSALVQLTASHLILPKSQHCFRWEPAAAKELLGFGPLGFSVSTFFTFLATQARPPDRWGSHLGGEARHLRHRSQFRLRANGPADDSRQQTIDPLLQPAAA